MATTEVTVGVIKDASITSAKMAANSVDSASYVDGSIDPEHLADNAVTLAKMASGTDGNIISFDSSGNPVAVATGSAAQVLTSAGAGQPPAFADAGGGGADYFSATMSGNQSLPGATHTKVLYATEVADSANKYNPSTSKWTPAAGSVFINAQIFTSLNSNHVSNIQIYKNGSTLARRILIHASSPPMANSISFIDVADGDDYYEIYAFTDDSTETLNAGSPTPAFFQGFMVLPA